ncbi:MAG: PleD family two-component system response regulator [Pseudomonadota bacterium]
MPGRILIVEDSATNRLILRTRLTQAYYDVIEAENGEQALELAKSGNPDLILLDVMMPGIDGFQTCRLLKADSTTLHIPVVMLTALDKQSDKVMGLEAGADDFLSKPFEEVALMSRVASLTRMKMMVDEIALRGEAGSGVSPAEMLEISRATTFPDSTVLIVSDDEDGAREMGRLLEREIRCRVENVEGGDEARAVIDFLSVDALILGESMRDTDPLRFGSMIRARPETRQSATLLVIAGNNIELATKALELGINDYIASPVDLVELTARLRSQLRRKHYSDQLRQNMRNTMVQAVTDPLTGTYNRRYANSHLNSLMDKCREKDTGLAVMMLDLDRFKLINDTYGHAAGDIVLKEFARRLQVNVRSMDLVARMGGEEFMVVMPDVTPDLGIEIAERVRSHTADPAFTIDEDGKSIEVTVSIGYAVLRDGELPSDLVKRADDALYDSKHGGRNRVTLSSKAA